MRESAVEDRQSTLTTLELRSFTGKPPLKRLGLSHFAITRMWTYNTIPSPPLRYREYFEL